MNILVFLVRNSSLFFKDVTPISYAIIIINFFEYIIYFTQETFTEY